MEKENHIIYIPGLQDRQFINKQLSKLLPVIWSLYGFKTYIIFPHWLEGNSFDPKLKKIIHKIDELASLNHLIYLIGQSAGASAVLNAFSERADVIAGVVNIAGRLKSGTDVKPTLDQASKLSPAFKQSVLLFENQNEKSLRETDRNKVLTLRPIWDEVVPASTVDLKGATNKVMPAFEHSIGGTLIATFGFPTIYKFLTQR